MGSEQALRPILPALSALDGPSSKQACRQTTPTMPTLYGASSHTAG